MVASRAFGVVAAPLLLLLGACMTMMALGTAQTAKELMLGGGGWQSDRELHSQRTVARVVLVLAALSTADLLCLHTCLAVWATAPGFEGGQWIQLLYLFLAGLAYFLAVMWAALLYTRHTLGLVDPLPTSALEFHSAQAESRPQEGAGTVVLPEAGTPTSSSAAFTALNSSDYSSSSSTLSLDL